MPRILCIKCKKEGNLTTKKTKTSGKTYEYYYIQHFIKETNKIEWCYLGSYDKLSSEYKEVVKNTIHKTTPSIHKQRLYTKQLHLYTNKH